MFDEALSFILEAASCLTVTASVRFVGLYSSGMRVLGLLPKNSSDGLYPSELFLGRRPRTLTPELYRPTNLADAITARHKAASKMKERASSNIEQPPLQVGDIVWMQEEVGHNKGQNKHLCTVIEVQSHGRSYYVKDMESRRIYLRNRKKLMLDKSECDTVAQTLLQETIMSDEINPCRRNGCLKSPNSKKIPKSV